MFTCRVVDLSLNRAAKPWFHHYLDPAKLPSVALFPEDKSATLLFHHHFFWGGLWNTTGSQSNYLVVHFRPASFFSDFGAKLLPIRWWFQLIYILTNVKLYHFPKELNKKNMLKPPAPAYSNAILPLPKISPFLVEDFSSWGSQTSTCLNSHSRLLLPSDS